MKIEVIKLCPIPHPESKKLALQRVTDERWCCLRVADWVGIEHAAHIPPGTKVDTTRPEFNWLPPTEGTLHVVAARTMAGVESWGLLVTAPTGLVPGDDAGPALGVP